MGKAKGKAGHKAQTVSQALREVRTVRDGSVVWIESSTSALTRTQNELIPSVLPESFAGTKTVSITFGTCTCLAFTP